MTNLYSCYEKVALRDVVGKYIIPSITYKINITSKTHKREMLKSCGTLKLGVKYGQCSELCGVAHNSISIVVEAVSLEKYLEWLNSMV